MRSRRFLALLLGLGLAACGDAGGEGGSTSGGGSSGGSGPASSSTGATGGGGADGGGGVGGANTSSGGAGGAAEGGAGGGGGTAEGYGALSGACGTVDLADVLSEVPSLVQNELDFTDRVPFDESLLTPGGYAIFEADNLGGSSLYSEIFAFEVLHRCEGFELLKTEGEIVYDVDGKKTDMLLSLDAQRVGVSVVRAMSFPKGDPYPVATALGVIEGKLDDILQSSANVSAADAWPKQVLAVVAQTAEHASSVETAWNMIDEATRADTIVYVTVVEGDDDFIFYE